MLQKTRLTSSLHFFQLIFEVKYFFGGHHKRLNRCFDWRGLMHEAGKGMGNIVCGGLGPPPPHPPPSARCLFIGFQNLTQPKCHFERLKLQFQ